MWSSEAKNKIWRLTFEDYDRILVFADGDDEGLDCARAVQGDLGRRARLVKCDKGEDVSSMMANGGRAKLQAAVGNIE